MITIVNLTMDGSDQLYTVPKTASSLAIHAKGGAITMRMAAGGDGWTLDDKDKESIDTRQIGSEKIYFNGTAGAILEIRLLNGVL
jgi:hypothetical protein